LSPLQPTQASVRAQTGVVPEQVDESVHWTQEPAVRPVVTQTGAVVVWQGSVAAEPLFPLQAAQVSFVPDVLQTGVVPTQAALEDEVHVPQVLFVVSQIVPLTFRVQSAFVRH